MGFPRQEYWSGLPFPSPGDLPEPGIEPRSQMLYRLSHTNVKFDEISNLASLQVNLNGVIHLDEGIRVTDGMSIMGYQMRDSFCPHKYLSYFAQFILGLPGVI